MDADFSNDNRLVKSNSRIVKKLTLKRAVFEFFNKGSGWKLTALVVDIKFLLWKIQHPGASFSDYYAGSIAGGLKQGRSHKTLGNKKFLSGSLASDPDQFSQAENQIRGTNYFEMAKKYGLQPDHICIDYGCGSLRVGQHLINYLQPGKYLGLDIVSDFYEAGKTLLADRVLETKTPQFQIINPIVIEAASIQYPHFIFSFAVLKHVPPTELNTYFRNIIGMMAPYSQAIITFNQAERSTRTGAKIWDYCQDEIIASVCEQELDLYCTINPMYTESEGEALPRISVLLIRKKEYSASSIYIAEI